MKLIFTLTLLPLLILSACEKQANITYTIKNVSSSAIRVSYINIKNNSGDQITTIPANNETTIAVNEQGTSRVSNYKEKGELLRSFTKIDIYKNDSVKAKTIFLISTCWTYHEKDKHRANYLLTVSNADF